MRHAVAISLLLVSIAVVPAVAADCPGNPTALGVSRTIVVDPTEHAKLGGLQYRESLPLEDREVVLTFDDGPLPPYTNRILDVLASECVKATFFLVGRMATAYPQQVRRVYNEGHTVANHSQNHPFTFRKMTVDQAAREIEDGFTSIRSALGNPEAVAPFFRIPGLLRQDSVEQYLAEHNVMTWSVDAVADDWMHINNHEVVRRAMNRLEAKGRGILLLHDIQPATALALPELLAQLKARGFKIVHVVPAGADRPKTVTTPEQWVLRHEPPGIWPRVLATNSSAAAPGFGAPSPQSFGASARVGAAVPVTLVGGPAGRRIDDGQEPAQPAWPWPGSIKTSPLPDAEVLSVPAMENFRYARTWRPRGAAMRMARKPAERRQMALTGAPKAPRSWAPRESRPAPVRTRPDGHQIQLPKPTAEVPAAPRETPAPPKATLGLLGQIGIIR
jgi:peptidoglycan/xylan/chitin deacetylase (PgdA/CDA1 family)